MMRKAILGAVVAAAAVTAIGGPAAASIPAPLEAIAPGSEIRRSTTFGDEWRSEVLKLHRDGTVTGNYQIRRSTLRYGATEFREGRIYGRWTIEHGKLCMFGTGFQFKYKNCFSIAKRHGYGKEYSAINLRTGDVWKTFIYPHGVF